MNVIAVADQLHAALRIVKCCADDTWVAVCERRHCVVQMGDMVCTCFHGCQRRVIICCGVADGNHDFIGNFFDKFQRTWHVRGQCHETDFSAARRIACAEELSVRSHDVLLCLCAFFDRIDERSFHVDAGDHFCFRLIFDCFDGSEDFQQIVFWQCHGCRAVRGDAVRFLVAQDLF